MKRFAFMLTLLLIVSLLGSACGSVFFSDGTSPVLHRDPLCLDLPPWNDAQTLQTVVFSSLDALYASPEGYLPCAECGALYPVTADEVTLPELYYYNPDGGTLLHTDPYCSAVSEKYQPLSGIMDAGQAAASGMTFCPVCAATARPNYSFTYYDCFLSLQEQAALLPGVWTLPSEQAISQEDAYQIAKAYVYTQPALLAKFPDELFTVGISHYDIGSADHPTETYKALIATVLGKPTALVCMDALTGEIYLSAWDDTE